MPFPNRLKTKRRGMLLDQHRDGGENCRECGGACCRSFSDVELSWEEFKRLQELGAKRLQLCLVGPPRLVIDFNCEFLIHGRCGIYESRPDICRRFICVEAP